MVEWARLKTSSLPERRSFQFLVGSVFGLDPGPLAEAYDRIYVGAGAAASQKGFFLAMLKRGGILVGPFDSQLLVLKKNLLGSVSSKVCPPPPPFVLESLTSFRSLSGASVLPCIPRERKIKEKQSWRSRDVFWLRRGFL